MDTQTNGGIIVSEQVFTNKSGVSGTAASPFHNLLFSKRYRVLKSIQMQLTQVNGSFDGTNIEIEGSHTPFSMHVDLHNTVANFTSTEGTIANEMDNGINLIAFCSTTAQAPVIIYQARLRFIG